MTPAMIDWYVGTGEPFDKAGGYAHPGRGGALVRRLDGSVTNVIGLPLAETLELLGACSRADHSPAATSFARRDLPRSVRSDSAHPGRLSVGRGPGVRSLALSGGGC